MATYRELQDRICLDWLNRNDLYSEAQRAIKAAINTFEAQRFWFNETATALTAAVGSNLSVPSNFLALDRLEITIGSSDLELAPLNFATLRRMQIDRTQGEPSHFGLYADQISFFPLPDSAYSINCYYVHSLPALSADADTNAWTTEAGDLVGHTAAMDLGFNVLRDSDIGQVHAAAAGLARAGLTRRNMARFSGRITPTCF